MERLNVSINGIDITALDLTMLDGSLDNLLKPNELKSLVMNENASIDGYLAILTDRKVKSRDVSVRFLVRSTSQIDLVKKIDYLTEFLTKGSKDVYGNDSGENRFHIIELERVYRLVYLKCDKYDGFGEDSAIVSITFKELNPLNRSL